jgi:hypothetical protein
MSHRLQSYLGYSYPSQFAELIRKAWPENAIAALPNDAHLRQILDTAYHASLLQEEQRPVSFRLLLARPEDVTNDTPSTLGIAAFNLDRPRPLNEQEIRRLCMAADFYRSLIAIAPNSNDHLKIWGIAVSGTRWVNRIDGGRFWGTPLPEQLVIQATAPGQLAILLGDKRIAALNQGQVGTYAFYVFSSEWLRNSFNSVRQDNRAELSQLLADLPIEPINIDFFRVMIQNVLRRTFSVVRNAKHGGTLVMIDPLDESALTRNPETLCRFKYQLTGATARERLRHLMIRAVRRLAELTTEKKIPGVGWNEYQSIEDRELTELDEDLFQYAHFLGDLMSVDGALIMTKRQGLLGFGAELRVNSPNLTGVRKALDVEATLWSNESLDDVGTRHRAVYRLCDQFPNAIAIVISQDGSVRFVKKHNGAVTYWNQLSW